MAAAYVSKGCRRCRGPKHRNKWGRYSSQYCESCLQTRRDGYVAPCGDPNHQHSYSCIACARIKRAKMLASAARGAETRRRNQSGYFKPFSADKFWQSRAHAAVQAAIKRGLLPSLKSGEYACTDCGGVAHEYDHRDYGRPLDVQPVCRSCNKQRGTAIWPAAEQFQFAKLTTPIPTPDREAA